MLETNLYSFMEWLVSANIHACLIFLLIVLLRASLNRQVAQGFGYFLWLILIARLLTPTVLVLQVPWLSSNEILVETPKQVDFEPNQKISSQANLRLENEKHPKESLSKSVRFLWGVFAVWLLGAVFLLLKTLLGIRDCLKIRNSASRALPNNLIQALGIAKTSIGFKRRVELVITDQMNAPASFGIVKPIIFLPRSVIEMNREQHLMILSHELLHHRRGDIVMFQLMELVKAIHWFNPLVWLAKEKMKQDCEFSCDAKVTRSFSKAERNNYAALLVSFATSSVSESKSYPINAMSERFSILKNRVIALQSQQVGGARQRLKIMACFIFVALIGLTKPVISSMNTQYVKLTEQTEFVMKLIPEGSFLMGSDNGRKNESPSHHVRISSFYLGAHEVTFNEWDLCVADGGCLHRPDDYGWGRGNRPVIDVSWDDIQQYIKWLSDKTAEKYRLPSEAEWEYAARGGTTTSYWWGDEIKQGYANCDDCGSLWDDQKTAPVGTFRPNPFGLYDTAGNVWEWVEDCWHENYASAPDDGSAWRSENEGDCRVRMVRGGSWDYFPDRLKVSNRSSWNSNYRYYNFVGFRLAKDI